MKLVDTQILELGIVQNVIDHKVEDCLYSYGIEPCGYTARLNDKYLFDGIEGEVQIDKNGTSYILIYPGIPYVLATIETFTFPNNITGMIFCKSSLIRQGMAGFFGAIEPGYNGNISSLFYNFSTKAILLKPGQGFIQIQFEKLYKKPKSIYTGRYQNSKGITGYKEVE
jgi:deoxycytidine triphosphate deaminase